MEEAVWRVELLGGLRVVTLRGEPHAAITRFRTQKTAALLAYLALHGEQPHSREIIQDMLWPDETVEAGRNALRVALHSLRKQLEPTGIPFGGILFADRTKIHLNSTACTTDVARFEQELSAQSSEGTEALKNALALYTGELLPGFYDDWVLKERERLQAVFVRAGLDLARSFLEVGHYEQALDPAQRAAQADPYSEEGCRLLMQAHARMGNPEAARKQYHRFVHLLRTEMNEVPSPQIRTLAAQLEQIAEAAGKAANRSESSEPTALSQPEPPTPVTTAPQAQTVTLPPTNALPFAFTPFFGRETEKAKLCALLANDAATTVRHVTLTGAGGTGKTRLAIETARALVSTYAGAVTFVSLMEEREARRIMETIAQALRLPRQVSGEYGEAVVAALSSTSTNALLILDGFEQLAAGGGSVVLYLLQAVPGLRLLITSRRRLEIPGEHEFPVPPLPIPVNEDALTLEQIADSPAVQLFLNRAQAAQNDFALTPRNFADLAAVVDALEGIPLALELAAARIRTVSVSQMRVQIAAPSHDKAGRFPLLTARRTADRPDRHRSLWATIAWSFEHLPPPLRRFFAHLSIFRGGWTVEAAQAVCDEPFASEYLTQLRAHSLVVAAEESVSPTEPRFRLLDSLREFAAEQLTESEQEILTKRHSAYFLQMANESQEGLKGDVQQKWLQKLNADYANLRAVLRRGGSDGLEMVGSLRQYWLVHGPLRESAETAADLLDKTEASYHDASKMDRKARAAALNTLGALHLRLGQYDLSEARLAQSMGLFRAQNDEAGIARVLSNQGILMVRQGNLPEGQAAQKESLVIRLRIGDTWGVAASYLNLGAVTHDMGDHQAAGEAYENSLRLSREIGDSRGMGAALLNLANLAASAQNTERARTYYEECLAIAKAQNNSGSLGIALLNLGGLLSNQPDTMDQAETHFAEAYRLYQKTGDHSLAGAALQELGRVAIAQKNFPLAHDRLVESLALPLTRVMMCVILESFGDLAFEQNQTARAVVLYGSVDAIRAASHVPRQTAAHEKAMQERLNFLRETLGLGPFGTYWSQGQKLSLEQVCDFARQPLLLEKQQPKKRPM